MSAPLSASLISSRLSAAAPAPTSGLAPAPRPLVRLWPMPILTSASQASSAWASVLQAMNSTPFMPASTMRLTALDPPPPTPTTLMTARYEDSICLGLAPIGPSYGFGMLPDGWGAASRKGPSMSWDTMPKVGQKGPRVNDPACLNPRVLLETIERVSLDCNSRYRLSLAYAKPLQIAHFTGRGLGPRRRWRSTPVRPRTGCRTRCSYFPMCRSSRRKRGVRGR